MKLAIVLFLLMILAFSVNGLGEIKHIDLVKGEIITVDLKVKEGVEFNLMEGRHIINVNKIHKDGADLDIFNFVDGDQKISYTTINRIRSLKQDLDRDGRGEIYVSLNKFFKYSGPNGKRLDGVSLDFFYPLDEDFDGVLGPNQITGNVVGDVNLSEDSGGFGRFLLYTIGILAVLIVLVFVLNKKKKVK